MKIDHPMWFANREYDIRDDMHRIWLKEQARMAGIQGLPIPRNRQPLRNGLKTIVRAPPPYASSDEKQVLFNGIDPNVKPNHHKLILKSASWSMKGILS